MVSLAGSSDTTTGLLSGENISFLNSVFKSIVGPLSLIPNACLSLCFTPGPVFVKLSMWTARGGWKEVGIQIHYPCELH